jgi:hypothetical protein
MSILLLFIQLRNLRFHSPMPNDKECPGPSAQYWDYEGEQPHRDTCASVQKDHLIYLDYRICKFTFNCKRF